MTKLSNEEANYLKLVILVNTIATPAVRVKFNHHFPPISLPITLKKEESKLRSMRVLNAMQLGLLYPSTGAPLSENFDITLMVCLLRNLTHIVVPSNGFDKLPTNYEIHDGADLARIKHYRNFLFHGNRSTIPTQQFNDIWTDLKAAVVRLDPDTKERCDTLESQTLTNQCLCYDSHKAEVKTWENEDTCFMPTAAVKYICDHLQTSNSITVTGLPGVGKSATIHHIALKLRNTEGYIIIPCRSPVDIPLHLIKGRKIAFVVDDICGKYTINENEVREWQKYLSQLTIVNSDDVKILTSNRYSIFQDPSFKRLKVFIEHVCDLSYGCNSISVEEKEKIALKYLPQDIFNQIKRCIGRIDYFPLMCQQYTIRPITDALNFFGNPYEIFEQELIAMKEEDKLKFCALLICVLLNGCIRNPEKNYERYIRLGAMEHESNTHETEIHGTHSKLSRSDLQAIFDVCELNRETPTKLIFRQYDCLLNTYMKMTDIYYTCIHDKVFECLCYYFGKQLQRHVIEYSDSKVIRDHTHISSLNEEHDTFSVLVQKENERQYFFRIVKDILKGKIYDVFCNNQMRFTSYRSKFKTFLLTDYYRMLNKLLSTKDKTRDKGTDPVTPLYIVCYKGYRDLAEFILDNTNYYFDQSYHPLNAAASSGNCGMLEFLISRGADVNYRDKSGHTPMTMACISKQEKVIQLLIYKGADLNKRTNKGPTPLMWVCTNSNKTLAELLIYHGADIDKSDYEGKTPVMCSRKHSSQKMFDFLIYKGANLNKGDNNAWTSLMWACFYGLTNIVETLIQNRANINQVNNVGWTSFMIACKGDKLEIVKLLIKKGVDLNKRDIFGRTALMLACTEGHHNVVNVLIKNKANLNCQDIYGVTPLVELCSQGQLILATTLINGNADLNKADNEGYTPLMASCFSNNYNLTTFLVDHSPDLNESNKNGETALLITCMGVINRTIAVCIDTGVYSNHYNNVDKRDPKYNKVALKIVKFLLSKGANVDQPDKDGWTPLMWSCKNNYIEIASELIENGAYIYHISSDGKSILQMALSNENNDIIELFFRENVDKLKKFIHAVKNNDVGTIQNLFDDEKRNCLQMYEDQNSLRQRRNTNMDRFLTIACEYGDENIVDLLLSTGVDINHKDEKMWTPLMRVCKLGHRAVMHLLVERGSCVTNDIFTAVKLGENNLAKSLIESGGDMNKVFIESCSRNDKRTQDLLIQFGVNMNEVVNLACCSHDCKAVKQVLNLGCDINICDEHGFTPLMTACLYSTDEIFQLLLKIGRANIFKSLIYANIKEGSPFRKILIGKCKNEDLFETLFQASIMGHLEIMQILIEKNVNVNQHHEDGYSPLMIACEKEYKSLVELLIDNGADTGEAFIWAFRHNDVISTRFLIECGADVNRIGPSEMSPLTWACFIKQEDETSDRCISLEFESIVDLLISGGADTNFALKQVCGIQYGTDKASAIELLINKGADINYTDENGCKLLKLLERDGNKECVKLLKLHRRNRKKCIII